VYVTSREEAKRQRALSLGAAGAFDSAEPYPVTADIVVDSIGPATWEKSMRTLRHGGRMCVCGGTTGPRSSSTSPACSSSSWTSSGELRQPGGVRPRHRAHGRRPAGGDRRDPAALGVPRALERLRTGDQLGKIVLEHF